MSERESLFQSLYRWLLESDLPVVLQVFWKLLCAALVGLLIYSVPSAHDPLAPWVIYPMAGVFAVVALFTKLGE